MKPILKWPGGKRWLADVIAEVMPKDTKRYLEPFLGGASIYLRVLPEVAILGDVNADLVNFYNCLKCDPALMQSQMQDHQSRHSVEYYYDVRGEVPQCKFERASRLLYLNRTCWNGLYRVNKFGKFNVPKGTKDRFDYDFGTFQDISKAFGAAEISCCDFEEILNLAKRGDFVFIDPPYTIKHNSNGFRKYNENIFSWNDQMRLANSVIKAASRGVAICSTNAAHYDVIDLYKCADTVVSIARSSVIASSASRRGVFSELLIRYNC